MDGGGAGGPLRWSVPNKCGAVPSRVLDSSATCVYATLATHRSRRSTDPLFRALVTLFFNLATILMVKSAAATVEHFLAILNPAGVKIAIYLVPLALLIG